MDKTHGAYTNGVLSGPGKPPVGQPWERRPGETEKAYRAFRVYLDLGSDRSIEGAAARLRKAASGPQPGRKWAGGSFRRWSKGHDWAGRALAYDNHVAAREVEAEARVRANSAEERAKGREVVDEESHLLAKQLKLRALEILRWPMSEEKKVGPDGSITIIAPIRWRLRDAAYFIKLGDELDRLAAGMPSRILATRVTDEGKDGAEGPEGDIPPELVNAWRDLAAARALGVLGIDDAQPEDEDDD